jgi:uncharacterized RDD family membrane protein YckC
VGQAEPPSPGEGTSKYPPADFRRRALARSIDLLLALAPLYLAPREHPLPGALLAGALLFFNDSLFGPGRSLGKRLAGLRVLIVATRKPSGVRESVLRNGVFVLGLVPAVAGWPAHYTAAALALIAIAEAAVVLRPLLRDLGQRRVGDLVAGTQVIDASVALGLPVRPQREALPPVAPLASRAARHLERELRCASR